MAKSTEKLEKLAALLERTGGDAKRIDVVRKTQSFRRSWLDLAESLSEVRRSKSYQKWGYDDFYAYCTKELTLQRATVDKLTISYHTLRSHAPQVLERDGVAHEIPSYQSIDYFSKAVGVEAPPEAAEEESPPTRKRQAARPRVEAAPADVEALGKAVFDEAKPVGDLRKQFNDVFFPKSEDREALDLNRKAAATARRLLDMIDQLDYLPKAKTARLRDSLLELGEQLQDKQEELKKAAAKKEAAPPSKKAPPKATQASKAKSEVDTAPKKRSRSKAAAAEA